jgi:hypothetical protein
MTKMPARPVLLVNLLGVLYFLFLALYSPLEAFKDRPLLTPVYLVSGSLAFGVGSVIYYHTFRQLHFDYGWSQKNRSPASFVQLG